MNRRHKIFSIIIGTACSLSFLSGCAVNYFEEEINVVFMNEGEMIGNGTVTQFKNIKSPTIGSAYIPDNYRFLGWTCYSMQELDLKNATHFKTQYIGGGRMVHYMDVKKFAVNSTVTCEALIMHKDDIPKDYHYAVVAWYDKAGTSGLSQGLMDKYEKMTKEYLLSEGVSQEDVNSVLFRPYTGNVGPSTGQILYDDDVDIMLGWGSVENITTTGSIPLAMIQETVELKVLYNGDTKTRQIHRISENAGGIKVMEYMKSEATTNYFNPPQE